MAPTNKFRYAGNTVKARVNQLISTKQNIADAKARLMSRPDYRPDIDGLRAVAVTAVVIFHAFPKLAPAGFIGVDIFFVISGFLISTIFFKNFERGQFNIYEFYRRRVLRLFPALLTVLVTCLVVSWFILLPSEFQEMAKQAAGAAAFVANFVFWNENGYFDTQSSLSKPLLHLWSLGVEEQFYIIWPIVLWVSWKRSFSFLSVATVIALFSFTSNLWLYRNNAIADFFMPFTRFWELMAGGVLAHLMLYRSAFLDHVKWRSETALNCQAWLGTSLLALGFCYTSEDGFPGWQALIPTIGTSFLISAGAYSWINRRILSHPVFVGIGLISYPLYLWHWPLLSFASFSDRGVFNGSMAMRGVRLAILLISFALAWATYRWIEKPLRAGSTRKTAPLLAGLMAAMLLSSLFAIHFGGFEYRPKRFEQFASFEHAANDWGYPGDMKKMLFEGQPFFEKRGGTTETTLFIGDSNIEQYYPRIKRLIEEDKKRSTNSVIFGTAGQCPPIPGVYSEYSSKNCPEMIDASFKLAILRPEISSVVLGASWFKEFSDGGHWVTMDGSNHLTIKPGSRAYVQALNNLRNYIRGIHKAGKKIYLVLNIPNGDSLDPRTMVKRSFAQFPAILQADTSHSVTVSSIRMTYGRIIEDLVALATDEKVTIIDPMKALCDNGVCQGVDSNKLPIYKDFGHLSVRYSENFASFIDPTVESARGGTTPPLPGN